MIGTNLFDQASDMTERERWTAVVTGAMLALLGLKRRSLPGALMAAGGGALMLRATAGHWPGSASLLGSKPDTKTALGGSRGVHVDESVTINRPPNVLYDTWRSLELLPRFIHHLVSVKRLSDSRSHWIADAPGGRTVEWDAEIINEVPNELIGWQSIPGADVASAGSVRFTPINAGQ